jgi:ABC-type sugar transport system ATPase subunit
MTDKAPVIKPIKVKEFEFKQSKYKQCGSLPVRSILLGPSGSGKGVLLQNMILDIYKKMF